jgi:CubicO group peptidase (beta-lactamase class C family)
VVQKISVFLLVVFALAVLPGLVWTQASGPRFRADGWSADELGRAEGYPAFAGAKGEQKKNLIGSYSRWDTLVPVHDIATSPDTAPLGRVAREPAIRFMSEGASRSLDDYLDQNPITGLLIARDDRILVERYQYDRRDSDRLQSMSMAKTITALLIGMAVQEGHIRSIADTAETYVPSLGNSEFGRTPIKAFLQMSSGIRFTHHISDVDGAAQPADDTAILNRFRQESVADAVRRFNERAAPPGMKFNYTSADNLVLGLVLAGATRRTVADYAREKLWEPLGAEAKAVWRIDRTGQEITACCFGATLRDYARLGLMLAHDGAWRGRQIVPRDWLIAATSVAPVDRRLRTVGQNLGYGYQTWLLSQPGRMFLLWGFRGQEVFVDPRTRTVMVQTAVLPAGTAPATSLWNGVLASLH